MRFAIIYSKKIYLDEGISIVGVSCPCKKVMFRRTALEGALGYHCRIGLGSATEDFLEPLRIFY